MKKNKLILGSLGSIILIGSTTPVVACNNPSVKKMFIKLANTGEEVPSEIVIQQTIEIAAYDEQGNVIENVTFESQDSTIEIKDGNKVTGIEEGYADIKASLEGYGDAHCYLDVMPLPSMSIKTLNGEELPNPILIKQSIQIAAYDKNGLQIKNATFSTSSKKIKITGNTVEGAAKGSAVIECEAEGYQPAEATINVDGVEVESIEINGNPYIDVQTTSTLLITVLPTDASDKSVTLTSDNTDVATVDKNGVITGVSSGKATITATANDGSGTKKEFNVYIKQPHIWGEEQAYIFDYDNMVERNITDLVKNGVCSPDSEFGTDIECDDGTKYDNHTFNLPIYLNPSLTEIPNKFLYYNYAFNQPLTIPNGLTKIGSYFLSQCPKFNQKIELPESITFIDEYFMYKAFAFNQKIKLPQNFTSIPDNFLHACTNFDQDFTISNNITTIGVCFLSGTSFNQQLILPEGLTTIKGGFLSGCDKFNQTLILPNSLTYVSDYSFMCGCNNMISTIDLQTLLVSVFKTEITADFCLATTNKNCPMYDKGIIIKGDKASDFRKKYKNLYGETAQKTYRNLHS